MYFYIMYICTNNKVGHEFERESEGTGRVGARGGVELHRCSVYMWSYREKAMRAVEKNFDIHWGFCNIFLLAKFPCNNIGSRIFLKHLF